MDFNGQRPLSEVTDKKQSADSTKVVKRVGNAGANYAWSY